MPPKWEELSDTPPVVPSWEWLSDQPPSARPTGILGTIGQAAGHASWETASLPLAVGQGLLNVGSGILGLPRTLYHTPGRVIEDIRSLAAAPGTTMLDWAERARRMVPMSESVAAAFRGQVPETSTVLREATEAAAPLALGGRIPRALEETPKAVVRKTASSQSRMQGAAGMMEQMPGRFGVSKDLVNRLYDTAERLSTTSMTQAPLLSFRRKLADAIAERQMNPLEAMRNKGLISQLQGTLDQLGARGNSMTARQLNAVIKDINEHIGSTEGAVRGMWKQALKGLHEDMRAAWQSTGDPAFGAYEAAIHTAWKNFLLEDFTEALNKSGMPMNRAGTSPIVAPGKIQNWFTNHPEWTSAVERAQPGLLSSLQSDLESIVPIANVTAPTIPGGHFGSGRLVAGGALGHLFRRALGLPPGIAEAMGALMGDLSKRGIHFDPARTVRAFQPTRTAPFAPVPAGLSFGLTRRQEDQP